MKNQFARATRGLLRRAMRTLGGIGWIRSRTGWYHPATGLRHS